MDGLTSTSKTTSKKRSRRCISSANHGGPMTPAGVLSASNRPRIILKVHKSLQGKMDAATEAAQRKQLPKEDQAIMQEIAAASSPRPKGYSDLGKGLPSISAKPQGIVPDRIPTVSHMIARLEKEILVSNTEDEDQALPGTALLREDTPPESTVSSNRETPETPNPQEGVSKRDAASTVDGDSEDDSDWTEDETSETGSSNRYLVEDESLGYVTSEDKGSLGEIAKQAVVEATLEGLGVEDPDLHAMDRAKKQIILRNTGLCELRRLERKKMVDNIDIGTVVLDRLDQDLQRIGMNGPSLLRLMELTDTLASGSFLLPLMDRKACIPNDLDLFASSESHALALLYLKKKGFKDSKCIYPTQRRVATYGDNLRDISFIYELKNKRAYKINVIVSKGRPLLPILQFHSTPVMNYLAFHGMVCLYDIMLYKLGIANYVEDAPKRVQACYAKYKDRLFTIWQYLEEEHTCKLDGCCPQTIRSLFDNDVLHIRFPEHVEIPQAELCKNEAKIAIWRLAMGAACNALSSDTVGFAICDSQYSYSRH